MKHFRTREFIRNVAVTTVVAAAAGAMLAGPAHAAASFLPPHQGPPGSDRGPWWNGADLTIALRQEPSAATQTWRLTCAPDGGTLPDADQACARLSQVWRPLAPAPGNTMCSTLYFGPQTVALTGWWHGSWVSVRYNRSNGCEETMWNQITWALGLPNGEVNPGGPMLPPRPGGHGG